MFFLHNQWNKLQSYGKAVFMLLRENQLGWRSSASIPETLGALCPCATDWKCLPFCKCKRCSPANTPLSCEGMCHLWFVLSYFRERDAQNWSSTGSEGIPPVSNSKLLQLWISPQWLILPHWLKWGSGETNPTGMKLLFFATCLPRSFQNFFLCNSKASVSRLFFGFAVFRIPTPPRNNLTFFIKSETHRNRNTFISVLKSKMPWQECPWGCNLHSALLPIYHAQLAWKSPMMIELS